MKEIAEQALEIVNRELELGHASRRQWHRIEDMDDVVNVPMPSRFYPSSR